MATLSGTTKRLLTRYKKFKDSEKAKKEAQEEFFKLATTEAEKTTLAQKTVLVPASFASDPEAYIEKYYPEWRLLDVKREPSVSALVEERPEYLPFSYTNKELGMTFSRSIRKGEPTLDDERLFEEDPDLYEQVVETVPQVKDFSELTSEQIAKLQPYVYRKRPSPALLQPRKATPEELDESN